MRGWPMRSCCAHFKPLLSIISVFNIEREKKTPTFHAARMRRNEKKKTISRAILVTLQYLFKLGIFFLAAHSRHASLEIIQILSLGNNIKCKQVPCKYWTVPNDIISYKRTVWCLSALPVRIYAYAIFFLGQRRNVLGAFSHPSLYTLQRSLRLLVWGFTLVACFRMERYGVTIKTIEPNRLPQRQAPIFGWYSTWYTFRATANTPSRCVVCVNESTRAGHW